MQFPRRRIAALFLLLLSLGLVGWAVTFGTLPPADFTFINGDEVQTLDPQQATGVIENRILDGLFEGLLRNQPAGEPGPDGVLPLKPGPGVAESYSVSDDGKDYTFHLRESARWSNGRPVTAHDFVWSWRRCLHPETASKYSYQLHYLQGAERYNLAATKVGERVEVELADRRHRLQLFPRGTILRGVLQEVVKPPEPTPPPDKKDKAATDAYQREKSRWRKRFVYQVEIKNEAEDGQLAWDQPGRLQAFSQTPSADVQECHHVLPDFDSEVGVKAIDDRTLVVTLANQTPFFPELAAFYTLFPVCRECIEEHGVPRWTKPEYIVTNGPYRLQFRRVRDRIRLAKNPRYWNAGQVQLDVIDALAVNSNTTALNMYLNGQVDWITTVPKTMVPDLQPRDDFLTAPLLSTYFYRLNVTRQPLDNALVRRALNLAIDKRELCERVTRAGEQPARSLVPPGLTGYVGATGGDHDPEAARRLLVEAGYPGGSNLPKIQILYNTNDNHRDIAQVIAQQWKTHLGIDVELRNLEWGVYLDAQKQLDYTVARAGWVGDYPDPNTFLDMFVTGGAQNQTGWSNAEYDRLIAQAAAEPDRERRAELLQRAERILMDELPILPLYFYVSINMVNRRVRGFAPNIQDLHPLMLLGVEPDGRGRQR